MDDNIFDNIVRIGTVSSVDMASHKVRVIYKDKDDMTSGWLYVPHHNSVWMPIIGQTVLVLYLPVFNGDGFILGAM